jgi:hypothetical protein
MEAIVDCTGNSMFGKIVWAKMTGYSYYWPAYIYDPSDDSLRISSAIKSAAIKAKDSKYAVFFYGSRNFGLIPFKNICEFTKESQLDSKIIGKQAKIPSGLEQAVLDAKIDLEFKPNERVSLLRVVVQKVTVKSKVRCLN